jgi:uncharacterized protein
MTLNLTQTDNSTAFDVEIEPHLIDLGEDIGRLTDTLRVFGTLTKKIVQVDVEGKLSGEIELECSRCLVNSTAKINSDFNVAFVEKEYFTTEIEAELNENDLDVSLYDGETIDVIELAREQLLLEIPTHFVCKTDCKGLCPQCGTNLNNQTCNCDKKEIDPRWAALKKLRD